MARARTAAQRKSAPTDEQRRAAFLDALAETANICKSCELAQLPRRTAYDWREADKSFAAAWEKALELGVDALEDEATRRGKDGVTKPVFQGGKLVGHVQEYSDTLLIFKLKGLRPERYRERYEHTGKDGGAIAVTSPDTVKLAQWLCLALAEGEVAIDAAKPAAQGAPSA